MELIKETLSDLRHKNRLRILEIIKRSEPTSRAYIAKLLNMSRSNVSEIVQILIEEGLITEEGVGDSTSQGGRRPTQLKFAPNSKYALGIDIGGSKTIAVVTNLRGECIARTKFASHPAGDGSALQHIRETVAKFLDESEISVDKIVATGVGIPTIANYETGDVKFAPGLSEGDVNIRNLFLTELPEPVYVDNDVNMAVIGERWIGNATGCKDVAFVAVGTGVGAGLIVNGKVLRGMSGMAGEIGYFHMDPFVDKPDTQLATYGVLESTASGRAIEQQIQYYKPKFPDSKLEDGMGMAEIFEQARDNDPLSLYLIDKMTKSIAFSISHLVLILNPERVLLGGGVAQVGESFVGPIRDRVQSLVPMKIAVERGQLGEDAAAYGAAAMALLETENLVLD
ncbi:ROK family transcriptional regulator [Alicyclobacillus sp. SO9]|uniref:ROK family transcriptional regulator n=1 Tax=Alicyclobacillus sp. SO9 TaxID=2665646 RepID=UPI0018E8B043|nr:ROK family transcriptional regulator [Alicyclobacillus sp. SO9]QQE80241.1 ROK family transcriptional regulator [Alicyclobacillus sp. SO9]